MPKEARMKKIRNLRAARMGRQVAQEPRFLTFGFRPSFVIRHSSFILRHPAQAFTLVEVLLALAICAIVLVAINAVFATAVRLRNRTSATVDEALPIERTVEM